MCPYKVAEFQALKAKYATAYQAPYERYLSQDRLERAEFSLSFPPREGGEGILLSLFL